MTRLLLKHESCRSSGRRARACACATLFVTFQKLAFIPLTGRRRVQSTLVSFPLKQSFSFLQSSFSKAPGWRSGGLRTPSSALRKDALLPEDGWRSRVHISRSVCVCVSSSHSTVSHLRLHRRLPPGALKVDSTTWQRDIPPHINTDLAQGRSDRVLTPCNLCQPWMWKRPDSSFRHVLIGQM